MRFIKADFHKQFCNCLWIFTIEKKIKNCNCFGYEIDVSDSEKRSKMLNVYSYIYM